MRYEKKGYLQEEFRLFHLKDTAGMRPEPHYHAFCKLLLLKSGSGGYTVEGQRYALEAGSSGPRSSSSSLSSDVSVNAVNAAPKRLPM